jgi:hypothetical protein
MSGVCVFPNQVIPQSAWGPVAKAILKFIPAPNLNEGGRPIFASSSIKGTTRDDKFAERIDLNTQHTGNWSFYYHFDDSAVGNPYAGGNIPGFGAVNALRGQQAICPTFTSSAPPRLMKPGSTLQGKEGTLAIWEDNGLWIPEGRTGNHSTRA